MTLDTNRIIDQARKLTEKRMESAGKIASAIAQRVEAEQHLKTAVEAEKRAFRDAERNGWTKAELAQLRPKSRRPRSERAGANGSPSYEERNDS